MTKNIIFEGGRETAFTSNAATPIRYRQIFGEDLMTAITQTGASSLSLDMVKRLAYVMALQGAGGDFRGASEETLISWLEDYEEMDFIDHAQDIISIWIDSSKRTSTAKKKDGRPTGK